MNPLRTTNFLDSCAFDPKVSPEDIAAEKIKALGDSGSISLLVTSSNLRELRHPNTPPRIRREAQAMIFTLEMDLTPDERIRFEIIHRILTGGGTPGKYEADAMHVFQAGKHGGYFITTDRRILNKRRELGVASLATIVKPSEWLESYCRHIV